ncbi:protein of unknown function DUF2154 [Gemmatirosa kalamazoonensis]|uniref:DUF2154 domain-containing protein n=1 Tax=Gemmatirosa kalamazoonensis TaxID=861299 RepID=W0RPM7_9BACT|nr:hypothetical protein [Gemmatirosa kalamazoonensis]AHG91448.1 protein of unknown function DUF2154 [Gemmatirosa kalamazoonensis]
MSRRVIAAGLLSLASLTPVARGQELKTLESSRQLHDSGATTVRVRYGAGRLSMRPTDDPQLYRMELRYDPDAVEPIHSFDPVSRRLELGVRGDHGRISHTRDMSMRVELARGVPMDLALELGATKAELDLSGLTLDALRLQAGASESAVRFDVPNPHPMRLLDIQVGAARFRGYDLANANAPLVSVNSGVGGVDLDFGGRWTQDVDLDLQLALGGSTIRVPADVGVSVEIDRAFASLDRDGLRRRGNAWVSDNWDDAPHRLRVRGSAAFGRLTIRHE